jgi:hypothetical protein
VAAARGKATLAAVGAWLVIAAVILMTLAARDQTAIRLHRVPPRPDVLRRLDS